jgi:O-antigen ligase
MRERIGVNIVTKRVAEGLLSGGAKRPAPHLSASWLLPLVFVLVFVHVRYVPSVAIGRVTLSLADVAMLIAFVAAARLVRRDRDLLPGAGLVWLALTLFLLWALADTFIPMTSGHAYDWRAHLVTWAKFAEYALLAPVAAVLIRGPGGVRPLLRTAVATATVAAIVAVAQFAGAPIFAAMRSGGRQPSFTGVHELGTLGGVALAIACVSLLRSRPQDRLLVRVGFVSGILCIVLSGAVAVALGVGISVTVVLLVGARRGWLRPATIALMVATLAVTEVGVVSIRAGDIAQFGRYLGLARKEHSTTADVQTYAQRSLLLYIATRIWEHNPIIGAGWQSAHEPSVFGPELPAAHAKFPDQPPLAFPSRQHPWGIDNAYVQALAELGVVGCALLVAVLGFGLLYGARSTLRDSPETAALALLGLAWLTLVIGVWAGQGYNISSYTDTAWLGLGVIGAAAAGATGA